jgi:predicted TIM-barrel fold metal-dependent hydrolase
MTDGATFPPAGSCDCHVHVVGPKDRFPLVRERTYTPKDALTADLRAMLARLGLERVVLVQPSVYGTDNACMLDAIAELGSGARGVAVLAADTAGSDLDDLNRRGVRGLRVNIATGGANSLDAIKDRLAAAAALGTRNGWHVQTFIPSDAIGPLEHTFRRLPVPVVIDHFGLIAPSGVESEAASALVRLLESGRTWVKLSGAYRIAEDPADPAIGPLARRLAAANPERVVWGSDWPHTPPHGHGRVADDQEQPYRDLDTRGLLALVRTWLDDARLQSLLLADNPARLYGFGS